MRAGSPNLRRSMPWIAAGALVAVLAVSAGTALAANTPPREGCGPLSIASEMEQLNATVGTQGRFLAVNLTYCDVEDLYIQLNTSVESYPPANWTVRHRQSDVVEIAVESPTNEMVGLNQVNVTICDTQAACTTERFHLLVENVNDPPRVARIQVTDLDGGYSTNLTYDNAKYDASPGSRLVFQVIVDDPDRHARAGEMAAPINPNETARCELQSSFRPGGEIPEPSPSVIPTIDPTTCIAEYEVPPRMVGLWTLAFTVRDAANGSSVFRIKLEITGGEGCSSRVLTPTANFLLEGRTTLNLSVSPCVQFLDSSNLMIVWTIRIDGGPTYTASGKRTSVAVENNGPTERGVLITVNITDNLDPAYPWTESLTLQGTIQGQPPTEEGFPARIVGGVAVAAVVGGWLLLRRRARGG